jgi:transglutaminase-like putative cysteine protease
MINPPRLLLGFTLLFWGWQSHFLLFAVPMGLILEIPHWLKWRWAFSDKDFNRVTDLTSLSLIIASIYIVSQQSIHGLMTLINWLPMLLFLLITAQVYSTHGTIKMSSLFFSLRRYEAKIGKPHHRANRRINLIYPYMMMCLLSASVTRSAWYLFGITLLIGYALWAVRPSRYSAVIWVFLLGIVGSLAYMSQLGLHRLHAQVEGVILDWFQEMLLNDREPYRQNTAIGDIGELKQSDKIILRVKSPHPLLLREASYNIYFKTIWRVKKYEMTEVFLNNEMNWPFVNDELSSTPDGTIKISAYLRKGKGMLALPHGTYQITDLPVSIMHRNEFGAVKVEKGPGLIDYTAHFGQNTPLDSPPTPDDLRMPPYEEYLTELSNQLNLPQKNPQEVLKTLTTFFNDFQYSLKLTRSAHITPLEHFLRESRAGHCEYFATATVLLLRTAGIPSRYASGYAVEEFSYLEEAYLVRQRHAHAWALAYINGRWQIFDTTPAAWFSLEEEMVAWWRGLYDLSAWFTYKFFQWRWSESENTHDWLLWLILPLSLILVYRLYSRKKVACSQPIKPLRTYQIAGADSAFYQIIQQLNAAGYIRQKGETLTTWLKRVQAPLLSEANMQTMLTLHQRYRFDPASITVQEKAILAAQVKAWLIMVNG